ncbi:MAG: hypothetical protein FWD64_07790 [Acidobacteriaceae bacterium]|nr:hypothetical protein [Acidobacteriaceae bacterium]
MPLLLLWLLPGGSGVWKDGTADFNPFVLHGIQEQVFKPILQWAAFLMTSGAIIEVAQWNLFSADTETFWCW